MRNAWRSMPCRIGSAGRASVDGPAKFGRIALLTLQWFMHPAAVRHGDLQSGMNRAQGQSEGLPTPISAVIAQGFVIATLANGAKTVISDSNRASMVRCKVNGPA